LTPNEKWLKLWSVDWKEGEKDKRWVFASRKKDPAIDNGRPDAVIVVPILNHNKLVLISEWRAILNGREFSFPAGLVNENEDIVEAAKRELREETGLSVTGVRKVSPPTFSSVGMTDESCAFVVADVVGNISNVEQEENEDIQVKAFGIKELEDLLEHRGEFENAKISSKTWPFIYFAVASVVENDKA
jgi:ADP-ribose pyrophosphatase